jgi:dynein heavy chain
LLRQFLDHAGWYNRKELNFMRLEDLILLGAMGPPGGGRSQITGRMVRHFNVLAYTELEEDIIKQMFVQIATFFFSRHNEAVKSGITNLVDSVLKM